MGECVFCDVASGVKSVRKVFEDEVCMAVVDAHPAAPGHVVVFPKKHHSILPQVPDEVVRHVGAVVQRVSRAIIVSEKVHGTSIFVASGVAAGQQSQHLLVHVIPRAEGDGLVFEREGVQGENRAELLGLVRAQIKELL